MSLESCPHFSRLIHIHVFLAHCIHGHLLQWHCAQHSQVGQIVQYDIAGDNSRETAFQTLEFLPLEEKPKSQYCMAHYNWLHPSDLACHRTTKDRRKGDADFLGTATVKEKTLYLQKTSCNPHEGSYFPITGEECLQTSFVSHMHTNRNCQLHLSITLHRRGNVQHKAYCCLYRL